MKLKLSSASLSGPRSKIILGLLSALGGSFVGLDRLYMGCKFSGILKLVLFIFLITVAVLNENNKLPDNTQLKQWAYNAFFLLMAWAFVDIVLVIFNLLSGQATAPYTMVCTASKAPWKSQQDILYGRYLGAVIVVTNIVIGYTVYSKIYKFIANLLD